MGSEQSQSHLLVVNGDETCCGNLCASLEQWGYLITIACSGQRALDMLALSHTEESPTHRFDAVLVAMRMPDMDGIRVLEGFKADRILGQVPVIMIATEDEDEQILKCLELGAEDYVQTPFKLALLRKRIDLCLERASLRTQKKHQENLIKLGHDMEIAREIQLDFLPRKLPEPVGWEIAARFHPARQVGGDFYDSFPLPGNKVGLVIADVCDKGIGPALFMALSRSLLRAFAEQHRPLGWMGNISDGDAVAPLKKGDNKRRRLLLSAGTSALLAVELTNNYIANNHSDMNMFATLFFGVLDPSTGLLTYINGGHDSPAIIGPDGTLKERLLLTGPAVGAMPDMDYDIRQVTIKPGEFLIAFTDGVTDALNPQTESFTENRLFSLLKEQPTSSAVAQLDLIQKALRDHMGTADQFDDITMLIARREPSPSA